MKRKKGLDKQALKEEKEKIAKGDEETVAKVSKKSKKKKAAEENDDDEDSEEEDKASAGDEKKEGAQQDKETNVPVKAVTPPAKNVPAAPWSFWHMTPVQQKSALMYSFVYLVAGVLFAVLYKKMRVRHA